MSSDCLSFKDTRRFSKLIEDYSDSHPDLESFFHRPFHSESFAPQMIEKAANFPFDHRNILVEVLKEQYADLTVSSKTSANIDALGSLETFTVTTGHQLNLFSGPLYFWYKIIDTIKLAAHLSTTHGKIVVPVFWMATEDHDFEEINHFYVQDQPIQWKGFNLGPVGRRDTTGIEPVLDLLKRTLKPGINGEYLISLFERSYQNHSNLSSATRYLVNELFGEDGLVILDADHPKLKTLFLPFLREELLQQTSFEKIEKTSEKLSEHYHKQVNPRPLNLFYLTHNQRVRIERLDNGFVSSGPNYKWSEEELLNEMELHPERFSPNALLRPLYQEVVLPNLCYVGGGAEIAYWLQLKSYFGSQNIVFPILKIRNSALLVSKQQQQKWEKLGLSGKDFLRPLKELTDEFALKSGESRPDFRGLYEQLDRQFRILKTHAEATDPSFMSAVEAQLSKQNKGLKNLEKRWLRAQNKMHFQSIQRIEGQYHEVNPSGKMQERLLNFASFYNEFGTKFKSQLQESIDPMTQGFYIIAL